LGRGRYWRFVLFATAPGRSHPFPRPGVGHGRCGITLLAGKAVGAPFVGAAAATLAVGKVLRLLHGGAVHELIDVDFKAPEYRSTVLTRQDMARGRRPGTPKTGGRRRGSRNRKTAAINV
jgi:hypothetical protein